MNKLHTAWLKKSFIFWGVLLLAAALSGCLASSGAGSLSVGPQISSRHTDAEGAKASSHLLKVDIVVPVFDPNISEDSNKLEKQGIYVELRRAEANRFALKMKSALEDQDSFGRVRVVPNSNATGDLYVKGKILTSNGEDVKIRITVADISGRQWFAKSFKHRVQKGFYKDIRNKGKDSYDPVFEEAAEYIVKKLSGRKAKELENWRRVAEIRFGASLSEETFSRYLKSQGKRVSLVAAPADDDPMLQRIKPIRVRDQLFIDGMQAHYTAFDQKMHKSYLVWQEQSMYEAKAAREARSKAIAQGIIGGLLLVAGAAAVLEGSDDALNQNTSEIVGGTVAAAAGAALLGASFQNSAAMKIHREALTELGQSIDIEIAPQVVEYENQTTKLVGTAAEQHRQWIAHLKKIYDLEATPDKAL